MSSPSLFVDPGRRQAHGGLVAAIRHRPRIYICALVVVLVYFATPHDIREATRALIAWNVGAFLFIALVGWMAAHATAQSCRAHAALEDENQWVLLVVGTGAACAALAAIIAELGAVKDMTGFNKAAHIALTGGTIVSAWTFIHLLFALHYAHQYYADDDGDPATPPPSRAGLQFPGDEPPTFGDFFYYSFVIGCACATADVNTISRVMRRTTLAHGVFAFFFNTVVLALTINIGAGLV
jgi:uncharacterized membrane protein